MKVTRITMVVGREPDIEVAKNGKFVREVATSCAWEVSEEVTKADIRILRLIISKLILISGIRISPLVYSMYDISVHLNICGSAATKANSPNWH